MQAEGGQGESRKLRQGERRKQKPRMGREQMQATAFIQTTAHRGTENLPFFAKRKRAGERLQAVPAREKIKGRGSAPGHGRMSSTERLTGQGSGHSPKPRAVVAGPPGAPFPATQGLQAGQGSGHCPKPRAVVVYGPSPGHLFLQRRAYRPDKEAGTARLLPGEGSPRTPPRGKGALRF